MPSRSNALSEIVRFWLDVRHSCFIRESVPVPVPYALSDIDLVAYRPDQQQFLLPGGTLIGPRVIVETKDEHDWDASGREFGKALRQDVAKFAEGPFIPIGSKEVKFTMLRQQHFTVAESLFGNSDFDRLLVVHAIDQPSLEQVADFLSQRRIFVVTVCDVVADLLVWYQAHKRPSGLRNSLVGDILHLLVGFCGLKLDNTVATRLQ
jgi:hypothetical protein